MMIHHMLSPSKRLQRQLIRNLQKFGCWVFGVCRSFAGVLSLAPLTLYAAAAKRSQKFFYHKSCIKKDKSLHTVTADTIIRNTVKRSNRLWQSLQTKNSVPSKISFIWKKTLSKNSTRMQVRPTILPCSRSTMPSRPAIRSITMRSTRS